TFPSPSNAACTKKPWNVRAQASSPFAAKTATKAGPPEVSIGPAPKSGAPAYRPVSAMRPADDTASPLTSTWGNAPQSEPDSGSTQDVPGNARAASSMSGAVDDGPDEEVSPLQAAIVEA